MQREWYLKRVSGCVGDEFDMGCNSNALNDVFGGALTFCHSK